MMHISDIMSVSRLQEAIKNGLVDAKVHDNGLTRLLNYTQRAQYSGAWTPEVLMCRGLIVHGETLDDSVVLARPFAKFANLDQYGPDSPFGSLPFDTPFEVQEKVDGSLIITFDLGSGPDFATRGSFVSDQANYAKALWDRRYASSVTIPKGVTVLFEYVAPWNQVVVPYEHEDLVFLTAIDIATGADVPFEWPGPVAKRLDAVNDMDAIRRYVQENDTAKAEGFVLRFITSPSTPSVRAKVKYQEYLRLHRLVTGVSTLSIWEHLAANESLDELLDRVPDEFYTFVTTTRTQLVTAYDDVMRRATTLVEPLRTLSRKDAAHEATTQTELPPGILFGLLDNKDVSATIWKMLRPRYEVPSLGTAPSA